MSNPYGNMPGQPGAGGRPAQPPYGQQPGYGAPQPGFGGQPPQQGYPQQGGYAAQPGYGAGGFGGPGGPTGQTYGPGGPGMPPRKPAAKVNTFLIVAIVGALLIGVVAWALFGRGSNDPAPPPTPPPTTTTTSPPPTTPTDPPTTPTDPPTTSTEPTDPPTTQPPSGDSVDLGHNIVVALPDGWSVHENVEPGLVVVTDGIGFVTLQTFVSDPGVDANAMMAIYIEQMAETFQNPVVSGPEPVDVGPNGTGSVMVMDGTRTSSSGSFQARLGTVISVRTADGVSILSALYTDPDLWELSLDGHSQMTNDMLDDLLG